MYVTADAITQATWALVVATALLVIATAIPAVVAVADLIRNRPRRAAEVLPDMHMLRSRLNGRIADLGRSGGRSPGVVETYSDDLGGQLKLLARIIANAPAQGMKFTNEVYIARHLLTQALYETNGAIEQAVAKGGNSVVTDDQLTRALNLCSAAKSSLVAAENLLPRRSRSIDGETFWERFSRVSLEREQGASTDLMRDRGR